MIIDTSEINDFFKGNFLKEHRILLKKLSAVKAFVFDWDGVFNNGIKDEHGSSSFSEIDAMGTNLLRFNYYLNADELPVVAIISGEQNKAAFALAKREHFNAVYYKMPDKTRALHHLCSKHKVEPGEIAFIFDDVLDFSVAQLCGLRIMVSRACNPLLVDFAEQHDLADYITFADGGHHAVRESVELLTGLSGKYKQTIEQRMNYTDTYKEYLKKRDKNQPVFYTNVESEIKEQPVLNLK